MKRIQWLGWFLTGALLTAGLDWNPAWEGEPDNNEQLNLGDNRIREFKDQVRKRLEVEHQVGQSGAMAVFDTGLHLLGSARVFDQNAAPVELGNDNGAYLASADSNRMNDLTENEDTGGGSQDQGTGRLWVDADGADNTAGTSDDNTTWLWNQTTDLFDRPIVAATPGAGISAFNAVYNGSFEITDGTGALASALCPLAATGGGWANSAPAPTCTYQDPTGISNGEGLAINVTGTGATGGLTQALAGLKASTRYIARARAFATVAGDVCTLRLTDGVTNAFDSTAGSAGYETLEVPITTTAGAATVTIKMEVAALGDVCRFDDVVFFEKDPTLVQPGIQPIYTQNSVEDNTIDTVFANNTFLSTAITIPGPGYVVMVDAQVGLATSGLSAIAARLARDDCAGGAFTAVGPVAAIGDRTGGGDLAAVIQANVPLNYVDTTATVGGTCIYRVEVREDAASAGIVNPITIFGGAIQTGSSLRLMLVPVR